MIKIRDSEKEIMPGGKRPEVTRSQLHKRWAYYDEWSKSLRPLDLLAFCNDDLMAKACVSVQMKARGSGDSQFSHIGLCVNSEILPNVPQLEKGVWYVWESTLSGRRESLGSATDVESGKGRLGVQIRQLEEVVDGYIKNENCEVAVCRLKNSPWENEEERNEVIEKMTKLHQKHGRAMYELYTYRLFTAAFRTENLSNLKRRFVGKINKRRNEEIDKIEEEKEFEKMEEGAKYLFCSELVALVYKHLGILPEDVNPEHIIPVDIVEGEFDIVESPFYVHKRHIVDEDKSIEGDVSRAEVQPVYKMEEK